MSATSGGYEAGIASAGVGSPPKVYLLLQPEGHMALMSAAQARAFASRTRQRSAALADRHALLEMADTLDELANEVEAAEATNG